MGMPATLKGRYRPNFPDKYKGDPANIWFRSSWERDVMQWLDKRTDVIWWMSEEKSFPYRDLTTGKWRRYYPDFIVGFKRDYGIETRVIEVKPKKQAEKPELPKSGRKTKSYKYQVEQYIRNQCKWEKMEKICEDNGWNFQILTEDNMPAWKKRK